jgi:hypothetical protein
MAKIKKISPIIIYGVPILIGAYLIYKSFKPTDKPKKTKLSDTETNPSGGLTPVVAKLFPLKRGSRGAKVEELQKAILIYDKGLLPKFGADKDFGSETENAVKTILGKITVDSQDDIDKIIKLASDKKTSNEAEAKLKTDNKNRRDLALTLIAEVKRKNTLDFYAIHPTFVKESSLTNDGRENDVKSYTYKKGTAIEARDALMSVKDNGYITLTRNKKLYLFSPYGFEVK